MTDPFSESEARKVDTGNVIGIYDKWPDIAREGFRTSIDIPGGRLKSACVMGMGGSAAGGEILAGWLAGAMGSEVAVYKGRLPSGRLKDSLAIACSASGETQETIDMMKQAIDRGAKVVAITAGGRLREAAEKRGVPVVKMPIFPAPRYSLPFIIFASLSIISRAFSLDSEAAAQKAFAGMDSEGKRISIRTPAPQNESKLLAARLLHKTPAIYGARVTRGVGIRFENVLNENSKKHAHFDEIPDVLHNEVEAWEDSNRDFFPVFIRHLAETSIESRKADALANLLRSELQGQEEERGPYEVWGRGRSSLCQLLTMVYRLDLVSYYIAVGLGVNPFPTRLIDSLKAGQSST